ncbi:MAG: hypothetical protein GY827_07515 [Cytophagales bacterium]|nr:hypothetical protein [Cytophagales bacterium]
MNKYTFLSFAVGLIVALTSCSKDEEVEVEVTPPEESTGIFSDFKLDTVLTLSSPIQSGSYYQVVDDQLYGVTSFQDSLKRIDLSTGEITTLGYYINGNINFKKFNNEEFLFFDENSEKVIKYNISTPLFTDKQTAYFENVRNASAIISDSILVNVDNSNNKLFLIDYKNGGDTLKSNSIPITSSSIIEIVSDSKGNLYSYQETDKTVVKIDVSNTESFGTILQNIQQNKNSALIKLDSWLEGYIVGEGTWDAESEVWNWKYTFVNSDDTEVGKIVINNNIDDLRGNNIRLSEDQQTAVIVDDDGKIYIYKK